MSPSSHDAYLLALVPKRFSCIHISQGGTSNLDFFNAVAMGSDGSSLLAGKFFLFSSVVLAGRDFRCRSNACEHGLMPSIPRMVGVERTTQYSISTLCWGRTNVQQTR